jgi:hypothetical protein
MAWRPVLDLYEALETARVDGEQVADLLRASGLAQVAVTRVRGEGGTTDFVRAVIPGRRGKLAGGEAPTLGVIGRLGGVGARPARLGYVSDGEGALVALSCALQLGRLAKGGDQLAGDVIVATHVCPRAAIRPHDPVPFMTAPVDQDVMNRHDVDQAMDGLLCVDTTRGNRILNRRGFAITPTVKEGYILRVSEDLLDLMEVVSGQPPAVLPITNQDVTPYGNGLFHLNSILQPSTATRAPAVGVALTSETVIAGSATGAAQLVDVEAATRFCVEAAKGFGEGTCRLYDEEEFARLTAVYGSLAHLQTYGRPDEEGGGAGDTSAT